MFGASTATSLATICLETSLLVGDIPFWDVDRPMRCERCKRRDLEVDILLPSASEGLKIRVRRLVEIRMVRRVIWRDDGG